MHEVFLKCSHVVGGKLCGKPVHKPMNGALGGCWEHSAHGVCCKCGRFWLDSTGPGKVKYYDVVHTAFSCVEV